MHDAAGDVDKSLGSGLLGSLTPNWIVCWSVCIIFIGLQCMMQHSVIMPSHAKRQVELAVAEHAHAEMHGLQSKLASC
jgi:hypothetical protein